MVVGFVAAPVLGIAQIAVIGSIGAAFSPAPEPTPVERSAE